MANVDFRMGLWDTTGTGAGRFSQFSLALRQHRNGLRKAPGGPRIFQLVTLVAIDRACAIPLMSLIHFPSIHVQLLQQVLRNSTEFINPPNCVFTGDGHMLQLPWHRIFTSPLRFRLGASWDMARALRALGALVKALALPATACGTCRRTWEWE